jgi:hypothetical protein
VSIGTLAKAKYFSHCLNQLTGSSPPKFGKSNFGLAIDKLKWFRFGYLGGLGVVKLELLGEVW